MTTRTPRRAARPLLRVRTGCLTCRARKKKCDEGKPNCRGCIRNELGCQWPAEQSHKPARHAARICSTSPDTENGPSSSQGIPRGEVTEALVSEISPPRLQCAPRQASSDVTDTLLEQFGQSFFDLNDGMLGLENGPSTPEVTTSESAESPPRPSDSPLDEVIPAQPPFLPQLDHGRFSLFGHYIQNTANSMANGATATNPFLVQLLPLAISSDLVLESILAQSCAHRAVRAPMITESETLSLYSKSLRSLRTTIQTVSSQTKEYLLALIVSMLILCFTETARGDTTGSIFFHLQATGSMLPGALVKLKSTIPRDLRSFLLEYYLYTATLSLISMDAGSQPETIMCSQLLQEGYELAGTGYIGSLCGCWLELILFLPQVFDLGSQWRSRAQEVTVNQIMAFSLLQSQISNWKPNDQAEHDVTLAGKVYQQALLLYLLTILDEPSSDKNSLHAAKIWEATSQAMLLLENLPATKQINTSLCWPLAVIGSCSLRPELQGKIRARLEIMAATIGLGNILKTKEILEYIWSQDLKGPWEISKAMQESGIWISFA